jgi:3-oxoacyl-[acyl-carrier protein] reductase
MGTLDGKVALVTGSGRGIGRAVAIKLAGEGARLVINDLDAEPGDAVVREIGDAGGRAVACNGSVTAQGFAERFVDTALKAFGGLDILVNNAGYTWDNVIQKMSDEQYQAILDVHLGAPFRILRAAAEPIRTLAKKEAAAGARVVRKIVNVSSVSATGGAPGQTNYCAAKMGVIGLTKALSKEWGRYAVTVNCVAFGMIETRLTQSLTGEQAAIDIEGRHIAVGVQPAVIEAMKQMIPMGRPGTPQEAAGSVYLFCIPESDYISGQTIVCGGGFGQVM